MQSSPASLLALVVGLLTLTTHAADAPSSAPKPPATAPATATAGSGRASPPVSPEAVERLELAAPAKPTAVPTRPRKVMVFCSVTGWRPPAISLVNKAVEILGRKSGAFELATVSEDASIFTPERLAEFDAIVMNNCNELRLSEERSRALQDFVKQGKGVVGLGSTISIINWPEESEMMGGFCFRHPFTGVPSNPKSEWAVKIDEPSHPLTRMFNPGGIRIKDVLYQIVGPYSRDRVRVLLSLDAQNHRTAALTEIRGSVNREFLAYRPDQDFAVAWIRDYGEGRVFFNILTHARGDMLFDPAIARHLLDGIQFALGDLKVDTRPNPGPATARPATVRSHKSVAAWTAQLNDANPEARVEAVIALGDLGRKSSTALPAVVRLLKDDAPDVRFFAATALGRLGAVAVPSVTGLLRDTNATVRAAAAQALGRVGPAARRATPELQALIHDANPLVRAEAVRAFGAVERATAVPLLVDLLQSTAPEVQGAAFDALGKMGPAAKAALPALTGILRGPATKADLANDGFYGGFYSQGPKMDALQTVSAMAELPEASDAIIASTSLFRGRGEKGLCPSLVFQAMGVNARPAVPALIDLLQEPVGNTQAYAATALGAIGPVAAEAIPALVGVLDSRNPFARVNATEALARLGKGAVPALTAALNHNDWLVRARAAEGLGLMGPAAAPAARRFGRRSRMEMPRCGAAPRRLWSD
jgi:HEAT repeat protein/type 1 glutamine amidotransferase